MDTSQRHFLTLTAAGSLAHEIVEELKDGPLCMKCIATRRRLTLVSVRQAVLRLRGAFLFDAIPPCGECGGRHALTLHA